MWLDLFWETYKEAQNSDPFAVIGSDTALPVMTIRLDGYAIRIRYLQSEPLIRAYPGILDADE